MTAIASLGWKTMPNAPTHDRINQVGTALAFPIATTATHSITLGVISASAFFISGYMFGPDLDMAHSRPSKRWGIFRVFWRGYRKWVAPRHRHPFSHFPVLGTTARVLYFGVTFGFWAWIAWMLVTVTLGKVSLESVLPSFAWATTNQIRDFVLGVRHWDPLTDYRVWCSAIGLEVGAASHYIPDYLSSWVKEWRE